MKRAITALLVFFFSPLLVVGYVLSIAYIMLWLGWQTGDEIVVNWRNKQ